MFWLFVIASLASAIYAILRRSWRWMLVSAVLYSPFAWYLNATPGFRGAWLILLFHLAASVALMRGNRPTAWLLLAPSMVLSAWVALLVIFQ
jgi:hypothetical protein